MGRQLLIAAELGDRDVAFVLGQEVADFIKNRALSVPVPMVGSAISIATNFILEIRVDDLAVLGLDQLDELAQFTAHILVRESAG